MKKQNGFIAAAIAAALASPVYAADVTITGAVEVEAAMAEDFAGAKSTDIVVATAAVGLDAKINDRVSATVAFLYEGDDAAFDGTTFGLDEGYITLQLNQMTSLVAGRVYVPFGSFQSNMVSDPQTLELGETSETVLMVSEDNGKISGSIYAFNGDVDEASEAPDNSALSFGANIAIATDSMLLGASYISNIAETGALEGVNPGSTVDAAVAGYGVNFGYNMGNFSVIAEHVTAAEGFQNGDLGTFDHDDDPLTADVNIIANEEQPRATNVEVAFGLQNGATLAAAYQVTSETAFLGLPKYVTSVAYTFEPMKDVSMGIEYATMEDFEVNGSETANAFTVQMAVEF